MHARKIVVATLLPMLALAACDDIEGLGEPNATTAQVRFVNVSGNSLSFAQNGTVGAGMGNLVFGTATTCTPVSITSPSLSAVVNGQTVPLSGLTSNLVGNGSYAIIAYPTAGGNTSYAILPTTHTSAAGQAGLRVFNATTTSFDVYTAAAGGAFTTASASGLVSGTSSNFFDVNAGTSQIRFNNAGTTTSALTLSNQNFNAGSNSILVIAPPATGTTTYRTFVVTGC
jgi:hypothetical protein